MRGTYILYNNDYMKYIIINYNNDYCNNHYCNLKYFVGEKFVFYV